MVNNEISKEPKGKLTIRTLAMPSNTNPSGDVFGGWVVSQMDLAGLSIAQKYAPHRVTTVAIDKTVFIAPVKVGDFVCCYAELVRLGNTSITVQVQTWAIGADENNRRQVTEGIFTYVAVDQNGRPEPVKK